MHGRFYVRCSTFEEVEAREVLTDQVIFPRILSKRKMKPEFESPFADPQGLIFFFIYDFSIMLNNLSHL